LRSSYALNELDLPPNFVHYAKQWYIGYTLNIDQRVEAHNDGKNISTSHGGPWKLIYYESYLEKMDALGREIFLKSGSGHRFIKKQLAHYFQN
jgi:putative endonuclease